MSNQSPQNSNESTNYFHNLQILYNGRNVTPKNLVEFKIDEDFEVPLDGNQLWSEYSDKQESIHSERKLIMKELKRSSSMIPDIETIIKEVNKYYKHSTIINILSYKIRSYGDVQLLFMHYNKLLSSYATVLIVLVFIIKHNQIQSTAEDTNFETEKDQVVLDFKMPSFIKIILEETDVIVFYEQPSVTVIKGSDEAAIVEEDNAAYEFLTSEKGI